MQAYIRKADAARALGEMRKCVTCLTDGVEIAVSLMRLSEAGAVIGKMPEEWQQETAVQDLYKHISRAIAVARRR